MPARCPRCGSSERTGKGRVTKQHITGTLRDGRPFNVIERYYAKCLGCNQTLAIRSYRNE